MVKNVYHIFNSGCNRLISAEAEARILLQRIREQADLTQDDEDAILLLLLSDQFGAIGSVPRPLISISSDDEEALLLAMASDPWTL